MCPPLWPFSQVSIEEFSPTARMTKCPDCDRKIPYTPSPRELEDMMEEARMRILKAQKVFLQGFRISILEFILNRKCNPKPNPDLCMPDASLSPC